MPNFFANFIVVLPKFISTTMAVSLFLKLCSTTSGGEKELVFAGQEGKVEIWDKDAYAKKKMDNDSFAELADDILGGDFMFSED